MVVAVIIMGIMQANSAIAIESTNDELIQEQFIEDNYDVSFEITENWGNHYNAKITVENISDLDIENWEMSFKTPDQITNIGAQKL